MSEQSIQQDIRLALGSAPGVRAFRNNVGAYKAPDGRVIRYGLFVGSSDLIGWRSVVITPDMVGQTFAQFLSVEVKTPKGVVSPEQRTWIENVRKAGGVAVVARSAADVQFLLA